MEISRSSLRGMLLSLTFIFSWYKSLLVVYMYRLFPSPSVFYSLQGDFSILIALPHCLDRFNFSILIKLFVIGNNLTTRPPSKFIQTVGSNHI